MHLSNQNIFILSLAKYDDGIESTMFTVARHLARNNRVFYIENPFTWKDFILGKRRKDMERRKKYFSFACNDVIDTDMANLKIVVTPPLASINWIPESVMYRAALKLNERIIRHRIMQIISKYEIKNYIFINSFNFYFPNLGQMLSPDLTVYHCVDPLVFSVDRKHGLVSERAIVERSNLVVCTSKKLYDEKIELNKNTYFIPNAADIKHSSKALHPDLPIHPHLANIKRPVAGYFGAIERRLDYDLLDYVTYANKDMSFVFTGPVSKEHVPSWFYNRSNVYLTGPVPYQQMPQVLKGFDAAIIPFKKDEYSTTIFPLKLFEYLGSGKPVVATDFNPDLKDFTGDTVSYCSNARSFSESLQGALLNDSELLKQDRLAIAEQNTWDKRAEEFGNLISRYISKNIKTNEEELQYDLKII